MDALLGLVKRIFFSRQTDKQHLEPTSSFSTCRYRGYPLPMQWATTPDYDVGTHTRLSLTRSGSRAGEPTGNHGDQRQLYPNLPAEKWLASLGSQEHEHHEGSVFTTTQYVRPIL